MSTENSDWDYGEPMTSAYVFRWTAGFGWGGGTRLLLPDMTNENHVGLSVSIAGDHVAAMAYSYSNSREREARVTVFHRVNTNIWDNGTPLLPASDVWYGTSRSLALSVGED